MRAGMIRRVTPRGVIRARRELMIVGISEPA
jgi:hypothetical protein